MPDPAPPAPRKTRGLVVLLWIVGGGVVLIGILLAVGAWLVLRDPKGREVADLVVESVRVMRAAQSAPGTKELRKAGCSEVLAVPAADMARIAGRGDSGAFTESRLTIVTCAVSVFAAPPSCDALAAVYAGAVDDGLPFVVAVQKTGASKAVCTETYSPSGERWVPSPQDDEDVDEAVDSDEPDEPPR